MPLESRSLKKPRSATMKRGVLLDSSVCEVLNVHEVLVVLLFAKAVMALMKESALCLKGLEAMLKPARA